MPLQRDPISVLLDTDARNLLVRAYHSPGQWQSTRLTPPGPGARAVAAAHGISLTAPDNPSVPGGNGLNARSRWGRAFVRALFYQHKWWSDGALGFRERKRTTARHAGAIEVAVGRWRPRTGRIPAGRNVQVIYRPGARAANRAARAEAPRNRIYDDQGQPGARWSSPDRRDW